MSEDSGVSNRGNSSDPWPISSPRGSRRGLSLAYPTPNGVLLFTGNDRCQDCDNLVLSDAHKFFIFGYSPEQIEHAPVMGGVPAEWRPLGESIPIPGDTGPPRVAFWQAGDPRVQVHAGPDTGDWTPCSSYTVTVSGLPYYLWMCRQAGPDNPCDDAFMREISS